MESKKEEALKALKTAERHFIERNLVVAKRHALEAQSLYPGLHGVSQMLASFNIFLASEARVNGEIDYYSILGLKPTADDKRVTNQFNKLSILLQRNKNKVVGADGALKLVSEAWSVLSDRARRSAYDMRRNKQLPSQNNLINSTSSLFHENAAAHIDHSHTAPVLHHRLDTFWTVCTSCKVQYEYLRKYLNKKLSCKNCRGVFLAAETGGTPVNGSYPFHTWSPMPTNGYAGNHINGAPYYPSNSTLYTGNRVHLGHGSEYSSNLTLQFSSSSKTSATVVIPNALPTNGQVKVKSTEKRKLADQDKGYMKTCSVQMSSNPSIAYRNPLFTKNGKIDKRRRVDLVADLKSLYNDTVSNTPCEVRLPYASTSVTIGHSLNASIFSQPQVRRLVIAPQLDIRNMLLDKAIKEIKRKLGEITFAAEAAVAADKNVAKCDENIKSIEVDTKREPISINVPDSDFHDFDKDRSEQCFKAKQIWALYDEEDGMPRLYCMIRQVLSLDPFSMHITYLSSKTSSEFGSVDWVAAGFTKSCGNFKTMHSEIVDQVNIFSHVLSDDIKAGRGGRVRIYPRSGDIWTIYRNWSPDWDSFTPDEVKRQYDMVEVVNDYTEECGVHIYPLIKLEGYNTVYRRSADETAIRWIPKQEMFRFSHQVPSWLLEGDAHGLPDGCWDLDPAATPDDLLHSAGQSGIMEEPKTSIIRNKLEHHSANDVQDSESSKCITEPTLEGLHHSDARLGIGENQLEPQENKLYPHPEVKQDQPRDTRKYPVTEAGQKLEEKLHVINFADIQAALQKVEIQCSTGLAVAEGEAALDMNQKDHFHYMDEGDSVEPNPYTSENVPHPPINHQDQYHHGEVQAGTDTHSPRQPLL